jgi:hypothetical protein
MDSLEMLTIQGDDRLLEILTILDFLTFHRHAEPRSDRRA